MSIALVHFPFAGSLACVKMLCSVVFSQHLCDVLVVCHHQLCCFAVTNLTLARSFSRSLAVSLYLSPFISLPLSLSLFLCHTRARARAHTHTHTQSTHKAHTQHTQSTHTPHTNHTHTQNTHTKHTHKAHTQSTHTKHTHAQSTKHKAHTKIVNYYTIEVMCA